MDSTIADFNVIPKDNTQASIPRLPCDDSLNGTGGGELGLAIGIFPLQQFRALNDPEQALMAGTLFKELELPFLGIGGALL